MTIIQKIGKFMTQSNLKNSQFLPGIEDSGENLFPEIQGIKIP
jgi:hypothetical protein